MKQEYQNICRLCKQNKKLTFEHIPPRSAFNKNVKYYSIPHDEYWNNILEYAINQKTYGKKIQRGFGNNCLCSECNTFLGSKYVRDYKRLAEGCLSMLNKYPEALHFEFNITENINTRNFLKQIIAIFICCNNSTFTDLYEELLPFVTDENEEYLPERYRIYMYLNNEGSHRNGSLSFTNLEGAICEFSFIPFGFVLNIDNPNQLERLYDITNLKYYGKRRKDEKLRMELNKFPTYLPIPLDYRLKEEIINSR